MFLRLRLGGTAVAFSALALAGCATLDVSSYVERGVDVTQYRTFAWAPAEEVSTGDPRLDNNRFFDEHVRGGVDTRLVARGFEKTSSTTADLLVHYHASFKQEIEARNIDQAYGSCDENDCRPEVFEVGTLLIDLVDTRTNRLVWRGWAKGSIDGVVDDQQWMEEKIDDVVTRILAGLPHKL